MYLPDKRNVGKEKRSKMRVQEWSEMNICLPDKRDVGKRNRYDKIVRYWSSWFRVLTSILRRSSENERLVVL